MKKILVSILTVVFATMMYNFSCAALAPGEIEMAMYGREIIFRSAIHSVIMFVFSLVLSWFLIRDRKLFKKLIDPELTVREKVKMKLSKNFFIALTSLLTVILVLACSNEMMPIIYRGKEVSFVNSSFMTSIMLVQLVILFVLTLFIRFYKNVNFIKYKVILYVLMIFLTIFLLLQIVIGIASIISFDSIFVR